MRTALPHAENEISLFFDENVIVCEAIAVSELQSKYFEKHYRAVFTDQNLMSNLKDWQFKEHSIMVTGKKPNVGKGGSISSL